MFTPVQEAEGVTWWVPPDLRTMQWIVYPCAPVSAMSIEHALGEGGSKRTCVELVCEGHSTAFPEK